MAKSKRQNAKKAEVKDEKEVVNYAETADAFAEELEEEVEEEPQEDADDSSEDENEDSESGENDSSDEEEEEEDGPNVSALFKGSSTAHDDIDEDSEGDDEEAKRIEVPTMNVKSGPEHCNFDLRNMTALNSHQIPASILYSAKKTKGEESICIPLDNGHDLQVDSDFLLDRASSGCAQLIAAIWQLPTEASDAGPLATLPGYDEITIPRAMVSATNCTRL